MNNKVYLVVRQWKDFEDYDCNGMQIEGVYKTKTGAIGKVTSTIYEELQCEMEFDELERSLTFKKKKEKMLKDNSLTLKQENGNGVTTIYIVEKEVLK